MDGVKPIPKEKYAIDFSREKFQPLLDALDKGDFDLARALTPEGYRLCGYKEFAETTEVSEYGKGWAGQFATVQVPPGRYPVFAREFDRHEAKGCYMNSVKDYPGILTWVEGTCTGSSDIYEHHPCPRVILESPYAHGVALGILSGNSSIRLIAPFEAKEVPFVSVLRGEKLVTYDIVDTSLPEFLKENPVHLRNGMTPEKPKLDSMIKAASQKVSGSEKPSVEPDLIR